MTTALRSDLKAIAEMIEPGSKVLDVGCGEGDLLDWLQKHKQVKGRGIEISQQGVNACIRKGLAVVQGNADTDLLEYPQGAYDYVVLSQTLQTLTAPKDTLEMLVKLARYAIVSVPNFGYWKNRIYLACKGRMPVTKTLSYAWYDTPNIHFCTISDFVALCEETDIKIEKRLYVTNQGVPAYFSRQGPFANLFGEQGIFMIRR